MGCKSASRARRADLRLPVRLLLSHHLHAYWHCPRPHRSFPSDASRPRLQALEQSPASACVGGTAPRFLPCDSSPLPCHSTCPAALGLGSSPVVLSGSTWLAASETN